LAAALVGCLLANAMRVRRKPQRPHPTLCYKLKTKFFKGSSAMPHLRRETGGAAYCASPEKHLRRADKRANFSAAKNLPFLHIKPKERHKIFNG